MSENPRVAWSIALLLFSALLCLVTTAGVAIRAVATATRIVNVVATTARVAGRVAQTVGAVATVGEIVRACAVRDRGSNCADSLASAASDAVADRFGGLINSRGLGLGNTMFDGRHVATPWRAVARSASGAYEIGSQVISECL